MLSELEGKVVALVGNALAARPAVSVVRAAGPPVPPDPGEGVAAVGLTGITPELGFDQEQTSLAGSGDSVTSRRVLPVRFTASVRLLRRPQTQTPAAVAAGRQLLLEDLTLVGYALGRSEVRSGEAFAVAAPDPGFLVRSFGLGNGDLLVEPSDGALVGELVYEGSADVWPPGPPEDEGVIGAVDLVVAALPIGFVVDDPTVAAGATTTVRIRAGNPSRLENLDPGDRSALRLAVVVISDLPPAERGSVEGGDPGAETGMRLVAVSAPETLVTYRAPEDPGAIRFEHVAVHAARPDGTRGVLLGTVAIQLLADGG